MGTMSTGKGELSRRAVQTIFILTFGVGVMVKNACALSVNRQIELLPKEASTLVSAAIGLDGGVYVTLQQEVASLFKMGRSGKILWRYKAKLEDNIDGGFESSAPLADGGAIVCMSGRTLGAVNTHYPGAVVKVDADGKRLGRYDPLNLRIATRGNSSCLADRAIGRPQIGVDFFQGRCALEPTSFDLSRQF